jgi:hypothetical protein
MATSATPPKQWKITYWYTTGNQRNSRKNTAIHNNNTANYSVQPNGSTKRSFTVQSIYHPTRSTAKRLALDDLLKNVLIPDHAKHGQYGYSGIGLIAIAGSNSV